MLHFAVSLADALDHAAKGRVFAALKTLADKRNFVSLTSVVEKAGVLSRLAKVGR